MTLRDGRILEYADLGDPDGTPVLFLPGTPGAAGQGAIVADAARVAGVRLLAVSRPGYAASTNSPPGLTSTASDVIELADQLGLEPVRDDGLLRWRAVRPRAGGPRTRPGHVGRRPGWHRGQSSS